MADNRMIGMMDSGFGGVSVLKHAIKVLPKESFLYYGDNANAPYGEKNAATIQKLSIDVVQNLVNANVKCVVVACNTSTSASIDILRETFSLPIISMEPAIKLALQSMDNEGVVLMMATAATCRLVRYQERKQNLDTDKQIIDIACHGLVESIEKRMVGQLDDVAQVINSLLTPYQDYNVKAIVLGCTHFAFAQNEIEAFASEHYGNDCRIFDGREGTIAQLERVLLREQIEADDTALQTVQIKSSGQDTLIIPAMKTFLQE